MRNKKRVQILISLITLIDDAELGERREDILTLLHSARRASQERDHFSAQQHSVNALRQLRKARHSLRVAGAAESDIALTDAAIAMLLPVYEDAQSDERVILVIQSLEWRMLVFLVLVAVSGTLLLSVVSWVQH